MKTVKKGILLDMMNQLGGYCYNGSVAMPDWLTFDGDYLGHGQFRFSEKTEKISLGDHWFARYDCARIFRTNVILPEEFRKGKVYLNLDFGGEALVRINGKLVNSVSSRENSGWVARDTVVMNHQDLVFGEPMEVELEINVDSAGFCDNAMDGAKEHEYTLSTARFVSVDSICEKYYLDCKFIWEALEFIKDEFIYESVYKALDDSLHIVDFDFDDIQVRSSVRTASAFLDKALSEIRYSAQAKVFMDGHSHIDVAWLWRVQESERKSARTFINTLSLMDTYPDYTFTQSQAIIYDMVKENYPEVYARIKEKVKNGQWNIVGNTWVECDTNIASGEAMIRQLLYGSEFFRKEFGVTSEIYWLPDCFGFSWALPQIIKRSGMKYFITAKLMNQDTNKFPHTLFRWKGADGSEILAYNQRTPYQGDYNPEQIYNAAYRNDCKEMLKTSFGMFGYGDGGGGSTYRMIESAKRLRAFPGLPEAEMAHPQKFFAGVENIREELPVYSDELYYENHRGTYSSQAFIKKGNRKNEFLLTKGEMTGVFSGGYDKEETDRLWKVLLKNQFHDILPGTSIHEAMEDCRPDFAMLEECGNALLHKALSSLNSEVNAPEDGIIVWNLHSHNVTGPVKVKTDRDVNAVMREYTENGERYIEFIAEDVPSMGFRFYPFGEKKEAPAVKCEKNVIENEFLRAELDENGIITSIFDKENNRETLCGKGNEISVFLDKCIHETAWNLEQNYVKKQWILEKAESIEVAESNSVRAVLRITRRFNKSTIMQDIILYAGRRQLDFDTTVDWQERDKVMKAAFDVDILNNEAAFETAHGAIMRPTHRNNPFDAAKFEQCAHKWADLSEGDYGVSILNDCKYGYDILGNKMRITMMRAPTCPDRTGDIGISTFVYSFYPHKGTWQTGGTVNSALELNFSLIGTEIKAQNGSAESGTSFVSVSHDDFVIDAVKTAENGEGIILRGYESCSFRGERTITLGIPFTSVTECNLMEKDEQEIPVNGNSFTIKIKPFEVRTFRIR